jgi:signal transduction histidine kinase/ligand-binding sensor domain-containing protein
MRLLWPLGLDSAGLGWHTGSVTGTAFQNRNSAWRRWLWPALLAALLAAVMGLWSASAKEYLIDVWDAEKKLPISSVTAITQTPDGYLWVGTYNGLARFDGVRFVTFDHFNQPELAHSRIQDLYVDAAGTLWINTYRGGLTSYRNGSFHREWAGLGEYDVHTALAWSSTSQVVFVTQFGEVLQHSLHGGTNGAWESSSPTGGARLKYQCSDQDNVLWLLTREGRVIRFINGEFKDLGEDAGLAGQTVLTLVSDSRGGVWAGTDQGIVKWDGKLFQPMTPTNGEARLSASYLLPTRDGGLWVLAGDRLRKQMGLSWTSEATEWRGLLGWASGRAMGLHEDREGGVWLNHYGNGLFHVTPDGRFERFTAREGLPGDRVWAWFQAREGDIWAGVDRGGLARLRERRFQAMESAEGLSGRAVMSVCEDEQGTLWFGTSGGGLWRWRNGEADGFPVGRDFSANFVFSAFPQAGVGLWVSASAGEDLFVFKDGQFRRAPWEVHGVKSILVDHVGRVWTGTKSGINWWLPETHRGFGSKDGLTFAVRALVETRQGVVWAGSDDGALYQCEPDKLQMFRPSDLLAGQPIWSLLAEEDGTIWAGTFRGGLLRLKEGRFSRVTTEQGLPSDVIGEMLEDGRGQFWLGTHQGICRVAKSALHACADGRTNRFESITYGRFDGLPSLECSSSYQPACWRGKDGRLWFSTVKGAVSVNPAELIRNPLPPPVVIEEMRVDGELCSTNGGAPQISPGHKQFEFKFTALSFSAPDRVRFRYRLEGLDANWFDADTRRLVQYNHLLAGDYRFQVKACNNDGVWNEAGASLAFTVQPYFYETWWFMTLCGVGALAAVAGFVRSVTTRKYRAAMAVLEQKHAVERDRTRIAKDIHDDLGAGLTQITLLSELARREPSAQTGTHLDKICNAARRMTRAMDEIVWAVDPQHDTLNGLLDYISAYAEDYMRVAGVRCRMDLPSDLPARRVDAELRYNLFLALKETLNNVVKHAQASEVWLRARFEDERLSLIVEDNGRGVDAEPLRESGDRLSSGRGMSNLEKRLATVGGTCQVQSAPGQGTRIELSVRLGRGAAAEGET